MSENSDEPQLQYYKKPMKGTRHLTKCVKCGQDMTPNYCGVPRKYCDVCREVKEREWVNLAAKKHYRYKKTPSYCILCGVLIKTAYQKKYCVECKSKVETQRAQASLRLLLAKKESKSK